MHAKSCTILPKYHQKIKLLQLPLVIDHQKQAPHRRFSPIHRQKWSPPRDVRDVRRRLVVESFHFRRDEAGLGIRGAKGGEASDGRTELKSCRLVDSEGDTW